ncbi:hypothetical protein VNI00_009995 [Paramarasmius palmivorus]|uniref:F-box domain-containing protein n=1 Tax=Paramarasmius palmivorus TaxID=297713 RepID=A0AAW0CQ49_9AGAR
MSSSETTQSTISPAQTRFSPLLKTNFSASAEDGKEIRGLLEVPIVERAQIDEELARLLARVEELKARRAEVDDFVQSHLALLSPVRAIPDDALAEIFVQCLPTDRNPSRSVAEAPILLTLVCKKWREVALQTPRLWSALHIYFPAMHPHLEAANKLRFKRRRDGVEEWFKRSGGLPITFSLVVSAYDPQFENYYKPIIKTLSSFSDRWQNVSFKVPQGMLKLFTRAVDADKVPLLRKMKIDYGSGAYHPYHHVLGGLGMGHPAHQSSGDMPFSNLLTKAPGLRSVSLTNYQHNVCGLPFAWDNLTELELISSYGSQQSPDAVLRVLRVAATSLRTCTLSILIQESGGGGPGADDSDSDEETVGDAKTVILPELRSLSVYPRVWGPPLWQHHNMMPTRDNSNSKIAAFFSAILCPSLTSLSYNSDQPTSTGMGPASNASRSSQLPFVRMLHKSNCQLKSLHITASASASAFIECLRAIPSLVQLGVQEKPGAANGRSTRTWEPLNVVSPQLVKHLTPTPENPQPICPRLEALRVYGNYAAKEESLIKLAECRSPHRVKEFVGAEDDMAGPSLTPLKQLVVYFGQDKDGRQPDESGEVQDKVITPRIKKLREEGMTVKMVFPPPYSTSDSPWAGQAPVASHQDLNPSVDGPEEYPGMGGAVPLSTLNGGQLAQVLGLGTFGGDGP